jgi:molecular chaperone DnaK
MERETIDFGIDLGTTNSSIAVFTGSGTRVFKNNEGQDYTPSAVLIDSKGKMVIGKKAKERSEYDSSNTAIEFKLKMGKSHFSHFAESGRKLLPEQLSAEILKSLRKDVQQSTGEEVRSAVISVPAAFELPQCDATNKAARLADLVFSPLIQEPVAAALAYGFQSDSDRIFWMVYDFGGGTFDVAIIRVYDGQIQVVTHSGDNYLGGKLVDWEIVQRLLVPAIMKEYTLSDFNLTNPKWKAAFAKLKLNAEQAKIELSREDQTDIIIDPLCNDDRGIPIRFEYELKRGDIEPLIQPFVERSINMCKSVMKEKKLSPDNIEKLILVGGPTLTPILQEILKSELDIPLECSVDPLTVNAHGAAIFAGTQRIPRELVTRSVIPAGKYGLELDYEPIGSGAEPLVGGKVSSPDGTALTGFTVELVHDKTNWRSGKITLSAEGTFVTSVHADEHENEFLVELADVAGNLCETVPHSFKYTKGMTITNQPLLHNIGVELFSGEVQPFLTKGTPLPARRREIHVTVTEVKKGDPNTRLRIPVREGENTKRADRNTLIGAIELPGDRVQRDIPVGSEVEITINMDESRILTIAAFIPIIDETIGDVWKPEDKSVSPKELAEDFQKEKERLQKVVQNVKETGTSSAAESMKRIEKENMVHDIESALSATDPDAPERCRKRLLDFKKALDEAEDALQWALLVSEAEQTIEGAREVVEKHGKGEDKQNFESLKSEVRGAIATRDSDLLRQKTEYLREFTIRILSEQPGWWVGYFQFLEERKPHMRDQSLAEQLVSQGHRAIENYDLETLRVVVSQMIGLLPAEEQIEAQRYGGTTMPKK